MTWAMATDASGGGIEPISSCDAQALLTVAAPDAAVITNASLLITRDGAN